MCCVKVVTPQGSADEMCCTGKEVPVDALSIYQRQPVVDNARCLFEWPWRISVPQTEMVATVHHQQ